jgi:DNA-binding beta-propeller fold protein YncE
MLWSKAVGAGGAGGVVEGWNVSTAVFVQTKSVAAQGTDPAGVFFRPDGLKMYIVEYAQDYVNEYDLSTAWDVSTAVFFQRFFVGARDTSMTGIFFKPDGLKMYVLGYIYDSVEEYNLSTAWDISTSVYIRSFSVVAQTTIPIGLFFKPDGTRMYVTDFNTAKIIEYNLSTPWSLSAVSLVRTKSGVSNPTGIFFKPDGLKMYVENFSLAQIDEYNLSTAWDISTAVFFQSKAIGTQETQPLGLFLKPDGTKMYVVGVTGDDVNEYNLTA